MKILNLVIILLSSWPCIAWPVTLNVGLQLEPPNLDPTSGAAAAIDDVVYGNIFEGLVRINEDGNVGIGTQSPAYKLHLEQAGGVMQQLKATDSNQAYMKFVNSATGDGQFTDGFLFGLDSDESVAIWNYEGTAKIGRAHV